MAPGLADGQLLRIHLPAALETVERKEDTDHCSSVFTWRRIRTSVRPDGYRDWSAERE
jgi:hypothetical protein